MRAAAPHEVVLGERLATPAASVAAPTRAQPQLRRRRRLAPQAQAALWLLAAAITGALLVHYYPDSYQQDGGTHFIFARWAWYHPDTFVSVWGRPLFTFLYAFPALLGYPAAKLLTVAICVATGWHTFRLAQDYGFARAPLAIPLLYLQPVFLLISGDTLTEPLFALLFVIALRLHVRGEVTKGMIVASLMILVRPEGFFLGLLWGVWVLFDKRGRHPWWRRLASLPWLGLGMAAWWLAALIITRDPLFILHNWPSNWSAAMYGTGGFWDYWRLRREILGPSLAYPFVLGLAVLLWRRKGVEITSSVLVLFVAHSVMRKYGVFGSAGYSRYFVCVAPAIALITLAGWNVIVGGITAVGRRLHLPRTARAVIAPATAILLLLSARSAALHVDGIGWSRDAWAVADAYSWFRAHPRPVHTLIWSQAYMAIIFDRDLRDALPFTGDREHNLNLIRSVPPGTLVLWDRNTGPVWYGLEPADFEAAGFQLLRSKSYSLRGRLPEWLRSRRDAAPWKQRMDLLYR
jgi:uncharacterized membrane protein